MDIDKITEILKRGGNLFMHKNDVERLREAAESGNKPALFDVVKIISDKTGTLEEGQAFAVDTNMHRTEFDFREVFKSK